ncbi:hypothetical protein [Aliivibrio fischeri]|uniref:hypothetical protein n=1 Tax=Aliivibrio fischeri TaxID=668 RepID=UPI00080E2C04|nr:hypothetical protein [Aliivibrio fischeri]OCH44041.1 hypothetical protein A6E02_03250 [Aliivibrio fischeri]
MKKNERVTPGFHKQFNLNRFGKSEQSVLKKLASSWFITSSGKQGNFSYCLIKPTTEFSEMFNLDREIVCVFSQYQNFDARSVDVFDQIFNKISGTRSETVCGVLVSADEDVEQKVDDLLNSDPEHSIIVPFTYKELFFNYDHKNVENKFRKKFYSRDLFSFLSPLKKDIYFFGRNNLVNEIVNRHKSSEHSSLFGLRKSGKTSIVYAIQRKLILSGFDYVSIDCESPSIHKLRWNELLEKLVKLYHESKDSKVRIVYDGRYEEKNAADSFEEDINKIYNSKKRISSLFIFDEIERISPETASSTHWSEPSDFIYFWQTLRGFYQKHPNIFTYMLVGTNPSCVESSQILFQENPIFASIPSQYVPSFTVEQVSEMVVNLGAYMGLEFNEYICMKLYEDFGGHPFLIRQMCSLLNKLASKTRPTKIDKALYIKALSAFYESSHEYLDMILQVLESWYPDEYEMLTLLANEDLETFDSFASDHIDYTRHLIGYGLVQKGHGGYAFNLDILSNHLKKRHKNERMNLSDPEKVQEISIRRNKLEKGLRVIIRNTLRASLGAKSARDKVGSAIIESRRMKYSELNLNEILHQDKSPLFFLELINILSRNWDEFKNVFEFEKTKLITMLNDINTIGRPDAHAKNIEQDDFIQLRLYFKKIEPILEDWGV